MNKDVKTMLSNQLRRYANAQDQLRRHTRMKILVLFAAIAALAGAAIIVIHKI